MSERSSKGSKTLEELLFDGSDSDSEDDSLHDKVSSSIPRFTLLDVAHHDSLTSSSVPLDSVRPVPNLRLAMKARQSYLKLLPMHQGIQQRVTDLQIPPRKSGGWVVC